MSDDEITIPVDRNLFSFWISGPIPDAEGNLPALLGATGANQGYYYDGVYPSDDCFMPLGQSSTFSVSISTSGSTTGVLSEGTASAIYVDGATGAVEDIRYRGMRPQLPTFDDSDNNHISNTEIIKRLEWMKTRVQMESGAYILRCYNLCVNKSSVWANTPLDLPVFIEQLSYSVNQGDPSRMDLLINMARRNINAGYSESSV